MGARTGRNCLQAFHRDTKSARFLSGSTVRNLGEWMAKLESFDQPIVFALSVTMVVLGMMALLGWLFASLHWTGPLGLLKGGVVQQ
jgi:hypothetical protein